MKHKNSKTIKMLKWYFQNLSENYKNTVINNYFSYSIYYLDCELMEWVINKNIKVDDNLYYQLMDEIIEVIDDENKYIYFYNLIPKKILYSPNVLFGIMCDLICYEKINLAKDIFNKNIDFLKKNEHIEQILKMIKIYHLNNIDPGNDWKSFFQQILEISKNS